MGFLSVWGTHWGLWAKGSQPVSEADGVCNCTSRESRQLAREAGNASRNVDIILPAPTLGDVPGAFLSWMTVPQWGNNSQDQRDNKDRRQCLDLFNTGGLRQGLSVSGKIRITDMRLKRGTVIPEILLVLGDKDKMTVRPSLPWWFGLSVPFLLCSLLSVYFLAEINFLQTFKCKGSWPETIVTNNCF